MAQDLKDPGTVDMYPLPRKRGRKPTGTAMTAADRQRAYRQRQADLGSSKLADLRHQVAWLKRENELLWRERNAASAANRKLEEEVAALRFLQGRP